MKLLTIWPWLLLGAALLLLAIATRLGRRMRAVQPAPITGLGSSWFPPRPTVEYPRILHVPGRDDSEIADRLIALTVLHHHEEGI